MRARLAILAAAAWLAGCSAAGPVAGGGSADQPASFELRWRESIAGMGYLSGWANSALGNPGMIRWRMRTDMGDMGDTILTPFLLGKSVYVASAKGQLLRLNAANGRREWRVRAGLTITGGVGGGDGLVVVGGEKGKVLAYGEDGKLRWTAQATSEVLSPPAIADGIVVVRSEDGNIAGLDATSGKRKWLYEHTLPVLVLRNSAGVVIRNGTVYAGFAGGKLVALDLATGNAKWETTLSEPRGTTELERISDITSLPVVDDQEVCAVSYQGRVGCFGLAQGNLRWSRKFSSDKGLVMDDKNLYVVSVAGDVVALDKNTGSSAWKNAQLDKQHTAAPAVLGNFLVAGDKKGFLYAIRREDGSIAAQLKTDGSPILSRPIVVDGGLVVQTHNGGLYSATLK